MIDWTQPVETTENPPRPVRVLFDKDGRPDACSIGGTLFNLFHEGAGVTAQSINERFALRNVAPKPTLREAWVVWDEDDVVVGTWRHAAQAANQTQAHPNSVYARAAVMSDGSPVERSYDDEMEIAALRKERDDWKAKAEAVVGDDAINETTWRGMWGDMKMDRDAWKVTAETWKRDRDALIDKAEALQDDLDEVREELRHRSAKLDAAMAAVQRVQPVVDAAKAWADDCDKSGVTRYLNTSSKHLFDAVRDLQDSEPVKDCTTCHWQGQHLHRCSLCNRATSYPNWEARHD